MASEQYLAKEAFLNNYENVGVVCLENCWT